MATIGFHSSYPCFNKSNHNPILPITNKPPQKLVSASMASPHSHLSIISADKEKYNYTDGSFPQKIDSLMQSCMRDIVINLKRAPLLVQVFSDNNRGKFKIQTEQGFAYNWPFLCNVWRNGGSRSPDGLIFVGELEHDLDEDGIKNQDLAMGVNKVWGIVVQGKGLGFGSACYLLKTSRVCAGMGLGYCTHFNLIRVSNFTDSVSELFGDSWQLG